MRKGDLIVLLHAHLPFVKHPEHEYALEEAWLYEACLECYLPLVRMLRGLAREGIRCPFTLSVSPTLLEMLADPLLRRRLLRHLDNVTALAEREAARLTSDPVLGALALMYARRSADLRDFHLKELHGDLLSALAETAPRAGVELITTCATHAFLPALAPLPEAVRAQVRLGQEALRRRLGVEPRGLWLPECGYYDGLDALLAEAGVEYFFLESHGLLHARPRPRYGVHYPVRTPAGPVAFARDAEAARRVWCARSGYPGHPAYREFHRDLGFELPVEELGEAFAPGGARAPTGIKYYRVTGGSGAKEPYEPDAALAKAREDAEDFIRMLAQRVGLLGEAARHAGAPFEPLVVAAYDAELFGHWWYEGLHWLEHLFRGLHGRRDIRAVTPGEYLRTRGGLETAAPALSSWGEGGYGGAWVDPANDWAIPRIHRAWMSWERLASVRLASVRLASVRLAARTEAGGTEHKRLLAQALREALLSQGSDWPFHMKKETAAPYAERRVREHLQNFARIEEMADAGKVDGDRLGELEERDSLFPWLTPETIPGACRRSSSSGSSKTRPRHRR
jgi:1,4-alpha-glucan branching enzyme